MLVKPTTVNFLQVFAVFGRTRSFLQLLAGRILNFLVLELLADKAQFNFFSPLACSAVQELLEPLLVCALFSGCTVGKFILRKVLEISKSMNFWPEKLVNVNNHTLGCHCNSHFQGHIKEIMEKKLSSWHMYPLSMWVFFAV